METYVVSSHLKKRKADKEALKRLFLKAEVKYATEDN